MWAGPSQRGPRAKRLWEQLDCGAAPRQVWGRGQAFQGEPAGGRGEKHGGLAPEGAPRMDTERFWEPPPAGGLDRGWGGSWEVEHIGAALSLRSKEEVQS